MSVQFNNLHRYLAEKVRPASPYQYLMLRALLEKNGYATTQKIADKIHSHYQYFPLEEYEKSRVDELPGTILANHGLVRPAGNGYELVSKYAPNEMSAIELEKLIGICKRGSKGWCINSNGRWTRPKQPRREPVS